MSDHEIPRYRYRGSVAPCAEVSRPLAVHRPKAAAGGSSATATSATIDIFDVIDSYGGWWGISAGEVKDALDTIGEVDTIYVRLNSPGGEATEGVAIANLLRANKAQVRVTVYGLAASAASMVAVGGDVVNMAPGSILMVHDALNIIYGNADELRAAAGVLDTISDSYAGVYATKAGGTAAEWRAIMREDKWYSAAAAVAAKLADAVGLDPTLPDNLPPVEDDEADDATVIQLDIEINPAARAAARRFDLSMLPNAPAALAPQTPASQPVAPSTTPEEADTMSDTIPKAVLEALGLPDDADEATVASAVTALQTERDEAKAQAARPKPTPSADEPKIPEGSVVVPQAYLDTLKEGSEAGKAALARQQREDRDKAIAKAQADGKIGRAQAEVEKWQTTWDRDPEGTAKWIDDLPTRFPVATLAGHPGGENIDTTQPFSDDEASVLGALAGVRKEALQA